jgi:hypothetical protein
MKIEIYEPAMCCPTGVCGPTVDTALVKLQETVRKIEENSGGRITVNRYNLSANPFAFSDNVEVGAVLRTEGTKALPLTYIDGKLVGKGAYLSPGEIQTKLAERGERIDLTHLPQFDVKFEKIREDFFG